MGATSPPRSLARKGTPAKTKAPSRVRDEARALYRKAILDAAEAVFAEKGMHVARVQDVAARAGLSVGAIYNYFEQKEDVLVALIGERMSALLEQFEVRAEDPAGFAEQLIARVTRFLVYTDAHRAFFQVANDHGLLGQNSAVGEHLLGGKKLPESGRFERVVSALVESGIAAGALAPVDVDFLALQLRHTLKSATLWRRTHVTANVSPAETAKLTIGLFMSGAAAKKSKR